MIGHRELPRARNAVWACSDDLYAFAGVTPTTNGGNMVFVCKSMGEAKKLGFHN